MTDRRWLAGLAVGFAAVIAVILVAFRWDPEPPASVRRPATARAAPKAAPAMVRAALPAPEGIEPSELPRERPPPATITGEDRRLMNVAVDDVLRAARSECLGPWLGREGDGAPAEFVFDAVLYDGRLVDVGLRSMRFDVPSDVMQCVADRAWYAEWPEWDLPGELRLQRSIEVLPAVEP